MDNFAHILHQKEVKVSMEMLVARSVFAATSGTAPLSTNLHISPPYYPPTTQGRDRSTSHPPGTLHKFILRFRGEYSKYLLDPDSSAKTRADPP